MSLKAFFLLLSTLTNLSLAFYVLIRNPRRVQNRVFSIFILNLVAWSAVNFLISISTDVNQVEVLGRWAYTFGSLIPANFLLFCLFFPEKIKRFPKMTITIAYLFSLFFIYAVQFTDLLQKGVSVHRDFFRPILGPVHPIWAVFEVAVMISGLYYLSQKWKATKSKYESLQIKTVFIGIALATIFALVVNVILPSLGISYFVSLGPTMTVVIVGFITYAIVRYRLFDITVALKRTLLYTLLTGLSTSVYMIAILLTERFLRGLTGYQSFIPIFLVSIFLAFTFLPIRERLQNFVDKVFFKKRYNYTKILRETAEELAKELNLGTLLKFIMENVSEAMGIEQASIWLKRGRLFYPLIHRNLSPNRLRPFSDNSPVIKWLKRKKDVVIREELEKMRPTYLMKEMDKQLEKLGAEIAVPIIREKEITGMIFLSNKKSGDIFTQEDINLLLTIASQAGTALENALLYDEAQSARIFQENILANMVSGVIGIEKKGEIRIFNERAGKFLHLNPVKVVGRDFRKIIGGEIRWVIDQVYLNRKTISRWEVKTPEGNSVEVDNKYILGVTGVPLIDKNKEFTGVLVVMVDLTEIRMLESKLRHSERLAAVGKLAATLAHEVKNPLASILTFTQLVKEGNRDPEVYTDFAVVAYEEAQRINNLLQELLDISRPEKLVLEESDINDLIRETMRFLKPEAEKRNVALIEKLDERIPVFSMDRNRLKQVIINLGMNALEAMEKGGSLSFATSYELMDEGFGKCVLLVKDTGRGISEEEIPYIFDIFYTTKKGGTGLGLALVKKIVETHGGSIEVTSTVKKGTEFRVVLPLRIRSAPELMEEIG